MKKYFILILSFLLFSILITGQIDQDIINNAENGDAMAQFQVGKIYFEGENIDPDMKKALKWFKLSAEQGHSQAQNYLGRMYYYARGTKKDLKKSY